MEQHVALKFFFKIQKILIAVYNLMNLTYIKDHYVYYPSRVFE